MRQSDPNARRTRTQHRGVYYRTGRDGRRRYEITFTDTDGRQRWTTVDGKLEDAIAARDAVKDRLRRGARVAPRKVTFEEAANAWLDRQTNVRPRTRESYDWALRVHLRP